MGDDPAGPFVPEAEPIPGAYSIDPAVFRDTDGQHYLYLGGIMGGQLQKYRDNIYGEDNEEPPADQAALLPRVARLTADMTRLAEAPRAVEILDENGELLLSGDHDRRFFEGAWVHLYEGTYYLSYSTGDTHYLVYATGDNPYGPFTYRGRVLEPVEGWTTHHSIAEWRGKWYLFYHDSVLSKGKTHLRSVKMTELTYTPEGAIVTIEPYGK
ncbi:Xylosidase/arabinosidase [Neolewinella maritima]|uniref:Xylosidase/arabinosidase n=1 Tax=Neolewinella maritima TaxID=1383882 RepID=A0ABM9AWT2_9BACT|nr:Xylosidase/arabinosidase [Neolewinella maritima]